MGKKRVLLISPFLIFSVSHELFHERKCMLDDRRRLSINCDVGRSRQLCPYRLVPLGKVAPPDTFSNVFLCIYAQQQCKRFPGSCELLGKMLLCAHSLPSYFSAIEQRCRA